MENNEKFADGEILVGEVIAHAFGMNRFKTPKPILALTLRTEKGALTHEMVLDNEIFAGTTGIQRVARTMRQLGVTVAGTEEAPKFLPSMPGLIGAKVLARMKRTVSQNGKVYFNVQYITPAAQVSAPLSSDLAASLFEGTQGDATDAIPF